LSNRYLTCGFLPTDLRPPPRECKPRYGELSGAGRQMVTAHPGKRKKGYDKTPVNNSSLDWQSTFIQSTLAHSNQQYTLGST